MREGFSGRQDAAQKAIATLQRSTGSTQPEILSALRKSPPDFAEADKRLAAVEAALGQPGAIEEPARAKQKLHAILAQSRYAGLYGQQSLWDRFVSWALTQVANLLANLNLDAVPSQVWYLLVALAALVTAGVALLIVRSGWSRAGRASATREVDVVQATRNRFAEADAAAARGDYTSALRSLVAGVATEVSGRPYWDTSPMTVRELFRGQPGFDQLRPLLIDFERAVYGGRPISEVEYRRAESIAGSFREEAAEPVAAA